MVYCLYPLYGKRSVVFNAGFQRLEQYLTLTILNLYWRLVSAIHTQMFSPERLEKGEQVRIMEVRLMVSKKTKNHSPWSLLCTLILFLQFLQYLTSVCHGCLPWGHHTSFQWAIFYAPSCQLMVVHSGIMLHAQVSRCLSSLFASGFIPQPVVDRSPTLCTSSFLTM